MAAAIDRGRILSDFRASVNMSADELEAWLATPEGVRAGSKKDGGEHHYIALARWSLMNWGHDPLKEDGTRAT